MLKKKHLLAIFLILSVIYFIGIFYYYNLMPEKIASHFGIDGRADAYSGKRSFITFSMVLYFIISGLFMSLGLAIRKLPTALLNIPRKDVLLNAKNREKTFDKVSNYMILFANLTLSLFIIVDYFVFKANVDGTMQLFPLFWVIMIAYILIMVGTALFMNKSLLQGIEE